MLTRSDYMANSTALHDTYYAEVAADLGIKITNPDLIERCRKALSNGDEWLNTIPLRQWDTMALGLHMTKERREKLKARGEGWSLGTGVCAFKAAAKKAVKEMKP